MKEDEGAKGPRGWSVMYKLFCMHPVVGREKEARPLPSTTIYHPPPRLTFAIFSSLSTLCKITPCPAVCGTTVCVGNAFNPPNVGASSSWTIH